MNLNDMSEKDKKALNIDLYMYSNHNKTILSKYADRYHRRMSLFNYSNEKYLMMHCHYKIYISHHGDHFYKLYNDQNSDVFKYLYNDQNSNVFKYESLYNKYKDMKDDDIITERMLSFEYMNYKAEADMVIIEKYDKK